MNSFAFPDQSAQLAAIQHRHAAALLQSGIAARAFERRFDEAWFKDATHSSASPESLPVVMADTSDRSNLYLYVFLRRGQHDSGVQGEEVNVATVRDPGLPAECIVPEDGYSIDEARLVLGFARELIGRHQEDLPNLSSNLLMITAD